MSGVRYWIAKDAPTGKASRDGKNTYSVPVMVEMSDAADGPERVLDYLDRQGLKIGTVYRVGNDHDPFSFCDGLTPKRVANSTTAWQIDATFSPLTQDNQNQTPTGEYTEDPELWQWQHSMSYSAWQEPCWKASNVTRFPHPDNADPPADAYDRMAGTEGPVVNSAGIPLDPTLMRDLYDRVWQITCYSREYYASISDAYMGAINAEWLRYHRNLARAYGLRQPRPKWMPYTIKCTNASATWRVATFRRLRIPYWEWNWEFRFRGEKWNEEVLDRGLTVRAPEGAADGVGGQMAAIPDGAAPSMPVLDGKGRRVPEPVLLNGAGLPLEAGDAAEPTGYFFEWRKDPVVAFSSIPFRFFET